ncbi:microtubule associated protein-domain-containing protein [Boeremia exigua]|uniref:microtubule associated protein-domain-containing protein n=1 Tax=Boeremia exigua TaxID=749465 RepID=UPI001E8E7F94|nr:microtubule associated protein-domain-containing protein [Boeremia exigua]KAH6641971.1 microtubule associated protein-domain-containing protein [Boeremia exigua]
MDTGYLAQQVTTIIGQLHGLFDEIGVPGHERDSREAELFSALSETLHGQLRTVTNEKHEMTEEAHRLIKTIKQMEASMSDSRSSAKYDDDEPQVTFPLTRCLKALKAKYNTLAKQHRERSENVQKLAEALESYASHLEPDFVKIKLPPTAPDGTIPPSFDISASYTAKLDAEFTRVYEEYTKRRSQVQVLCQEIIQLWAELGTPQAQTDSAIVENHRDAPEQLGLHAEDLGVLKTRKERLIEEKHGRERRIAQLRATIEELWERLSVDPSEQKHFLASNRGCGLRTVNEFEDELSRLNELKRQNLHIFVEEARLKLQELWDALYFSEEEMLDFTPAFSEVCSDALLSAHEAEISRLESLKEQRLPILSKIDRHRELIKERSDLQQSSQDASRLMGRGQKGEKRDPGKLLREEKMRKRIAKELPKVEAELRATLEAYEDEWGRPFLVHGERYLDELYAASQPRPRSKTPSSASTSSTNMPSKQGTLTKSNSFARPRAGTIHGQTTHGQTNHRQTMHEPPSRVKTPVSVNFGASTMRGNPFAQSVSAASGSKSPSKLPTRAAPKVMGSPERRPGTLHRTDSTLSRAESTHSTHSRGDSILSTASSLHSRADSQSSTMRRMGPPMAPPPRMKDLFIPPDPAETPRNRFEFNRGERSESIVRSIPPEDPYNDRFSQTMRPGYPVSSQAHAPNHSLSSSDSSRHISQASSTGSGQAASENWETFSEQSDDAPESDVDFQTYRRSQVKRPTPDHAATPRPIQGKKVRGIRNVADGSTTMDQDGRMVRCSEAGWTDDGSVY